MAAPLKTFVFNQRVEALPLVFGQPVVGLLLELISNLLAVRPLMMIRNT
jgi:hypothetical protein